MTPLDIAKAQKCKKAQDEWESKCFRENLEDCGPKKMWCSMFCSAYTVGMLRFKEELCAADRLGTPLVSEQKWCECKK